MPHTIIKKPRIITRKPGAILKRRIRLQLPVTRTLPPDTAIKLMIMRLKRARHMRVITVISPSSPACLGFLPTHWMPMAAGSWGPPVNPTGRAPVRY